MKVLHVIPAVAPTYGGPSRVVLDMCRALQDDGLKPLIATTDANWRSRLEVELGKQVVYEEVPTVFHPRQWSESFKYSRPLTRWLDTNVADFDLVHVHAVFSHSSVAAARACRRQGVPYLVSPHGSLDPWSLRRKRLLKLLLWRFGVREMLQGAAAILYTTSEECRLAESSLELSPGVAIPLGIDEEILQSSADPGDFRRSYPDLDGAPYAITLCRLHPKKGLELLLEAFLDLIEQERFRHWRLIVAGQGDSSYTTRLRKRVSEREGNQSVLFVGWLSGQQKIGALRGAALLTLISYQENFGLSVTEAMASGVPVLVSSKVNLAGDIVEANAGWIVPLEPKAIAAGLAEAFEQDSERARRGKAGRELVLRRYRWSHVSEKLAKLYASISTNEKP